MLRSVRPLLVAGAIVALLVSVGWWLVAATAGEDDRQARQEPRQAVITVAADMAVLERTLVTRAIRSAARMWTVPVPSGVDPVVTAVTSEAGATITEGTTLVEIAGNPIIVLRGAFPAWRDFSTGMDPGPDVEVLQAALQRLELYGGAIDGRFGPGTLASLRTLYVDAGYPTQATRTTFPRSELLFLPRQARTVDRISISVGDVFTTDSISIRSGSERFAIAALPDQAALVQPGTTVRILDGAGGVLQEATVATRTDLTPEGNDAPNLSFTLDQPVVGPPDGGLVVELVLETTGEPVLVVPWVALGDNGAGGYVVRAIDSGQPKVVTVDVLLVTDDGVGIDASDPLLQPGVEILLSESQPDDTP